LFLGQKLKTTLEYSKMGLHNYWKKKFKKREKGRGVSGPQPRFWPISRSQLGLPPCLSLPSPPHVRRQRRCCRGEPACRVVAMRRCDSVRSDTRTPLPLPPRLSLSFVLLLACSHPLTLAAAAAAAPPSCHRRRGTKLLHLAPPTLSFEFEATVDLVSPPCTQRTRSTHLSKPDLAARAHQSEL